MQLEVVKIVERKVTKIANFGAFVDLGDGLTGMVHISEVASTYVKDINDYLKENQMVKVMVLNIGDDGKIALSMKRTQESKTPSNRQQSARPNGNIRGNHGNRENATNTASFNPRAEWTPKKQQPQSFEDMLTKFKQSSDEKMSDLKRTLDNKRGSYSRRGSR